MMRDRNYVTAENGIETKRDRGRDVPILRLVGMPLSSHRIPIYDDVVVVVSVISDVLVIDADDADAFSLISSTLFQEHIRFDDKK